MIKSEVIFEKLAKDKKDKKDGTVGTPVKTILGGSAGLALGAGVDVARRKWAFSPNRVKNVVEAFNPTNLSKLPGMKLKAAGKIALAPNKYLKVLGAAGLGAGLLYNSLKKDKDQ